MVNEQRHPDEAAAAAISITHIPNVINARRRVTNGWQNNARHCGGNVGSVKYNGHLQFGL